MEEYKYFGFWENLFRILNFQEHKLTNKQEFIELIAYSTVAFLVPLIFKQPQMLVGTIVNTMLILTALNMKGLKVLPIIILPSIAAALGGYLFGGFTIYLVYLIPFIWIGNAIIVIAFKYFKMQKNNSYISTLSIGSFAKAGFLFGAAYVLVSFSIVPSIFLTTMGIIQFATAITGGTVAVIIQNLKKNVILQ